MQSESETNSKDANGLKPGKGNGRRGSENDANSEKRERRTGRREGIEIALGQETFVDENIKTT